MSTFVHENKRSLLAFELASVNSLAEAAQKFLVCHKTIYRQLKKPEFRLLVHRYRDQMLASAVGRLTNCMIRAADSLGSTLDSDNPHIRVRASRAIISLGLDLRDAVETNGRLDEVESELESRRMA